MNLLIELRYASFNAIGSTICLVIPVNSSSNCIFTNFFEYSLTIYELVFLHRDYYLHYNDVTDAIIIYTQ